jgi:hypothetical protein
MPAVPGCLPVVADPTESAKLMAELKNLPVK